MTCLYTRDQALEHKKKEKRLRIGAVIIAAAALAVCVTLCAFVRTGNAEQLLLAAVAVSTLGGWAVIFLRECCLKPVRALRRHEEGILESAEKGGPTEREGILKSIGHYVSLKGSITFFLLKLKNDEETVEIKVPKEKLPLLPNQNAHVHVLTVRGYLFSWEAKDE